MPAKVRERDATWAAVLGVLAMFCGLLGPFAFRTGLRSLSNINRSRGALRGSGAALFGVVAGAIGTTFLILGIAWFLGSSLL